MNRLQHQVQLRQYCIAVNQMNRCAEDKGVTNQSRSLINIQWGCRSGLQERRADKQQITNRAAYRTGIAQRSSYHLLNVLLASADVGVAQPINLISQKQFITISNKGRGVRLLTGHDKQTRRQAEKEKQNPRDIPRCVYLIFPRGSPRRWKLFIVYEVNREKCNMAFIAGIDINLQLIGL